MEEKSTIEDKLSCHRAQVHQDMKPTFTNTGGNANPNRNGFKMRKLGEHGGEGAQSILFI